MIKDINIEFLSTKTRTNKELSNIILDSVLYDTTLEQSNNFYIATNPHHFNDLYLVILKIDNNLVGCCVIENHHISVFVKEQYRWKGYAKTLVEYALKETNHQKFEVYAITRPDTTADIFWLKIGIVSLPSHTMPLGKDRAKLIMTGKLSIKQARLEYIKEELQLKRRTICQIN